MPYHHTCPTCSTPFTHKRLRVLCCSRACSTLARRKQSVESLPERFWANVAITGDLFSCWLWTGGLFGTGYGQLSVASVPAYTHRISWELHFGSIPDGLHVCHHCDNPPCCRPDHLFLGTQKENARDRENKGRNNFQRRPASRPRGSLSGTAKLTESDVAEIRRSGYLMGVTKASLGRAYDVSETTITAILSRRIWRHVP